MCKYVWLAVLRSITEADNVTGAGSLVLRHALCTTRHGELGRLSRRRGQAGGTAAAGAVGTGHCPIFHRIQVHFQQWRVSRRQHHMQCR